MFIFLSDVVVVGMSFILAYIIRQSLSEVQPISFYVPLVLYSMIAFVFSSAVFRMYGNHRSPLSFSYLTDYLRALSLWSFFLVAFPFFTKTDYSRVVMVLFFASTLFLTIGIKFFFAWREWERERTFTDKEMHTVLGELVNISALSADHLALLEGVRRRGTSGSVYAFSKRVLDIALGSFGLLLTCLLYPLIAVLIRRDSRGPVLIRQRRVGKDGKPFTLYKFRTMVANTELYAKSPRSGKDGRVTNAGAYLRRFSLDELPQFWNVLLGEMSIVGPRPEMPFIAQTYSNWQKIRLTVKPGITGIWQILGRKDLPLEENIEYDLYYVYHQSFFLDLAIILRTIPHLCFPRGAY